MTYQGPPAMLCLLMVVLWTITSFDRSGKGLAQLDDKS
jgi:hypothetical protein